MVHDLLKELQSKAVKTKPRKGGKPSDPVDVFRHRLQVQMAIASARRDGRKTITDKFAKEYTTDPKRGDWFKKEDLTDRYWVQFGFDPINIGDENNELYFIPAKDLDEVGTIFGQVLKVLDEDEGFRRRVVAATQARSKRASKVEEPVKPRRGRKPKQA